MQQSERSFSNTTARIHSHVLKLGNASLRKESEELHIDKKLNKVINRYYSLIRKSNDRSYMVVN